MRAGRRGDCPSHLFAVTPQREDGMAESPVRQLGFGFGLSQAAERAAPEFRPAKRRLRDRRCPSGSGRGKAPSSGCRPARHPRKGGRWKAKAGHPLARENSADGQRKRVFLLRSRVRAQAPASGSTERDERKRGRHRDRTVDWVDGAPTPSGACSQPSASWVCPVGEVGPGSCDTWLCSRAVLIAEVDGKRRARSAPSVEGG